MDREDGDGKEAKQCKDKIRGKSSSPRTTPARQRHTTLQKQASGDVNCFLYPNPKVSVLAWLFIIECQCGAHVDILQCVLDLLLQKNNTRRCYSNVTTKSVIKHKKICSVCIVFFLLDIFACFPSNFLDTTTKQ